MKLALLLFCLFGLFNGYFHIEAKIEKKDKCYLPDQCELIKYHGRYESVLICKNLYSKFDEKRFNETINTCKKLKHAINRFRQYFRLIIAPENDWSSRILKNSSFEIYKILTSLAPKLERNTWIIKLQLLDLKGFDLNLILNFTFHNVLELEFVNVDFEFYKNDKLLKSCDEYEESNSSISKNYIFSQCEACSYVKFQSSRFKTPICPLVFNSTDFYDLYFNDLIKSYYKTNVFRFLNYSKPIDFNVTYFILENFYGLDLDSNLIPVNMFRRMPNFVFDGEINSIQTDLFKSLTSLKSIKFSPIYFGSFVKRRGIEWIRSINYGLKVDLGDLSSVKENIDMIKEIGFEVWTSNSFYSDSKKHFFNDEDFCLFRDFPFEQLVTFNLYLYYGMNKLDSSCTTLWLIQYYPVYIKFIPINKMLEYNQTFQIINNAESLLTKCDFEKRIKMCKKSHHYSNKNLNKMNFIIFFMTFHLIITPLICLFGILTNIQIIFVVIKNRSTLKENQYIYMAVNSGSNIVILMIQIFELINECHEPFGLYCSAVYKYKVAQYFKIIFGETISSFFRLLSNFTFLAFSINRLSLIGKQNKLFEFFSKMKIKIYIGIVIIISAIFSLIKAFRFKINTSNPNEPYPLIFYRMSLIVGDLDDKPLFVFLFIMDAIYDFLNYVLFTLINLIFDIVLLVKIRKTLKEKEEKSKKIHANLPEEIREKKKKENEEAMNRVILMVVLNALVSFLCKMPLSFISLNDLRLLIVNKFEDLPISMKWKRESFDYSSSLFCHMNDICEIFTNYGQFLYFVSLSVNIFFFYAFDLKFKLAFRKLMFKNEAKTTNQSNIPSTLSNPEMK